MKYSFYCLPLRKHVKAKITAIVKKKSYSVKGIHKEGGKEYNLNKVIGKAEAERISKETGIDIDEGQMVAAAEEFLPEGSGHVIGQNTAGMETAIEGTEETVTANTTPFRSESPDPADDDDNIGPMSMAAEVDTSPERLPGESTKEMMKRRDTPEYQAARKERQKKKREDIQQTAPYLKVKSYEKYKTGTGNHKGYVLDVGLPSKVLLHMKDLRNSGMKIDEIDTIQVHSQEGGRFPIIVDNRFKGWQGFGAEKKNCGCGQDPCVTYGSETKKPEAEEDCDLNYHLRCNECRICLDCRPEADAGGVVCRSCTELSEEKDAEVDEAGDIVIETVEETPLESTGYETFVVSEEHWDKVYQHQEWDDEITEMVHVYRNSDGIAIQVPHPFADDVLEMIIATQDMPMDAIFNSEAPSTRSSLVGLGIGIIGLAAAFALYRRYDKEE